MQQFFFKIYYIITISAESPPPPTNTRHCVFYLILCASFSRRKAISLKPDVQVAKLRTKLAAGVVRTCAREPFVNLRKLVLLLLCALSCRLWSFLGSPSQRSKVGWDTNGVFCHLRVIFLKCSKQALVSGSVDSTELFPLLPPQYNPVLAIFYL